MTTLACTSATVERGGRQILQNADLTLALGEFHILIGPNGSGKSTLLRALAGLWPLAGGNVELDDKPLAAFRRREIAREVSYVPQDTRIDFAFTVREIVAMGRFALRTRFQSESPEDRQAVDDALMQCDSATLSDRSVNTLSGGERQRVVIARSLASKARFLLLDEPTANLDARHALEIFELGVRLARAGTGVLLATHDLTLAMRYAERLTVLHAGSVRATGMAEAIFTPALASDVFGVAFDRLQAPSGSTAFHIRPLAR